MWIASCFSPLNREGKNEYLPTHKKCVGKPWQEMKAIDQISCGYYLQRKNGFNWVQFFSSLIPFQVVMTYGALTSDSFQTDETKKYCPYYYCESKLCVMCSNWIVARQMETLTAHLHKINVIKVKTLLLMLKKKFHGFTKCEHE